jgi:PAS domain S-box-containing protein
MWRTFFRGKPPKTVSIPLEITGVYLLVGGLWIFFSDKLLELFVTDAGTLTQIAIMKGWFYVAATGLMLYGLIARNISQIRSSQEETRLTEMKYRELVESANSIIMRRDPTGRITFFNEFAQSFFGYKEHEILGRNVVGTIVPEVDESGRNLKAMIHDIGRRPERYANNENENMRRNGERVWISWTNKPIRDERGEITEILCIGNDITHRKEAEEGLRRYELLVAHSRDIILFVRRDDGRILEANQAATKAYGYSRDQLLQMTIHQLRAPETLALLSEQMMTADVHGILLETVHRRSDGTAFLVEVSSRGETVDGSRTLISVVRDITERKRAEEEARAHAERFKVFFSSVNDAIFVHPLRQEGFAPFIEVNDIACERYGYSKEEFLQLSAPDITRKADANAHGAPEHRKKLLEAGHLVFETVHIKKSGQEFPVEINANIVEQYGKPVILAVVRDITERKLAEEALLESELRWQFALEGAGDGLWDWNVKSNEVFFSRQWKTMLGFEEHEITNMLGEWEKRVHPEDKDRVLSDLRRHLDGHSPVYVNEHRMLCKDGTYKWILDRGKVVSWTEDGKPLRAIGTHSDISERKRSEEALQESEKRLRRAELVAQLGNWEFVLDSMEARGSDGARAIYGIKESSWSIADVQKIPLPEYRPMLDKALRELTEEGKPYNVEFKIRRPTDGKILDIHSVAEYSPQRRAVFGVIQDITKHKLAEEALRASEEKYRQVVENAHDAIFIAQDGLIKFPNPCLASLSGYSLEELTQKPFVEFVHPEDRELVATTYRRRLQGEAVPHTYSFRALNKAGDVLWAELSSVLLTWEGRPALLNFLRDITVEKKLESQLVHAQKMEAVGTLAGGIAHDFNNLLQAVQGYAEFLLLRKEEGEPGYRELNEIVRAAKRGGELTRQLLTFSRRVESKLQPVDLNRIVEDLSSILDRTIPKMIKIELHLTGHLHLVNADTSQVGQILMNLAVNARDAMPEGGTLTIETSNVILDEDDRRSQPELSPGKYVLLAVRDTGQGMDSATLANIFDPFFTTKEVGKGTGLGLAIVYGIVKSHHGHIKCVSKPGGGTAFEIYLPASEHPERASTFVTGAEALSGGHETILLVDDDDSLRDLGRDILETCGYTALSAPDGKSALQIYQECGDRIDLVILDLIMPGMGGEQCLHKLLMINPAAKVVIASGYAWNGETEKTAHSGAKAFIQKPYDVRQMLQVVRDVLDG